MITAIRCAKDAETTVLEDRSLLFRKPSWSLEAFALADMDSHEDKLHEFVLGTRGPNFLRHLYPSCIRLQSCFDNTAFK